jgi:hypothetical protein
MPDAEPSSPPPQTKPAPAVAPRPWYRLHWSTWIVIAAVLAFFALMNLPGRVNNQVHFFGSPIYYEHGWPFVFLDRCYSSSPPKAFDENLEKYRAKKLLPWAESPNYGFVGEGFRWAESSSFGSVEADFRDGDSFLFEKNNWSLTGKWYLYKRWLGLDILIAIIATVPFAVAYEFWSRRRWHYSLRFLLIFVFLVAVGMAWWRTGVNRYEREMKAVKALHEKGYVVSLQCEAPTVLQIFMGKNNLRPYTHVGAILQYSLYDESRIATDADLEYIGDLTHLKHLILHYTSITDKTLERLHGLANLEELTLDNTKITDDGLKTLRDLPRLRCISLDDTRITGDGVKELNNLESVSLKNTLIADEPFLNLSALSRLLALDLSGTKVTDEGLRYLAGMPKLKYLYLNDTQVTDDGLKHLENMPQLEKLEINGTKVTTEGIDKLQGVLPNCKIDWSWREYKKTRHGETAQPTSDAKDDEK